MTKQLSNDLKATANLLNAYLKKHGKNLTPAEKQEYRQAIAYFNGLSTLSDNGIPTVQTVR